MDNKISLIKYMTDPVGVEQSPVYHFGVGMKHGLTGAVAGPAMTMAQVEKYAPPIYAKAMLDALAQHPLTDQPLTTNDLRDVGMNVNAESDIKKFMKQTNKDYRKLPYSNDISSSLGEMTGYSLPWALGAPLKTTMGLVGSSGMEGFTDYSSDTSIPHRLMNAGTNMVIGTGIAGALKGLTSTVAAGAARLHYNDIAEKTKYARRIFDALSGNLNHDLNVTANALNTGRHVETNLKDLLMREDPISADRFDEAFAAWKDQKAINQQLENDFSNKKSLYQDKINEVLDKVGLGTLQPMQSPGVEMQAAFLKKSGLIPILNKTPFEVSPVMKDSAKRYAPMSDRTFNMINVGGDIGASAKDKIFPDD